MAINQNHLFEELNGVKCAIVEKNAAPARVDFLRRLLEYNGLTVVTAPSPPPKAAPPPAASVPPKAPTDSTASPVPPLPAVAPPVPPAPETFTVGVTNVMFNPINAIFGRLLKSPGGHTVTLAYWHQKEQEPDDETPYFAEK
jgi:hypothetical protein